MSEMARVAERRLPDDRDLCIQDLAMDLVRMTERALVAECDRATYREFACVSLDELHAQSAETARLRRRLLSLLEQDRRDRPATERAA